ncbi:MAG: hypothetical protein MJ133_02435 [Lachnospiraceae bacterium]|nr:hypothetical protein [Lachnospiraceae bacterium]
MKKKKLKYILIWLLPALLLIGSIYTFVYQAIIYMYANEKWERLDSFAVLVISIAHFIGFLVSGSIATAITIYLHKRR